MKRHIMFVLAVLILTTCMFAMALGMFDSVALSNETYDEYQARLNVYESVGVSPEDLRQVQFDMAQSLKFGSMENTEVSLFGMRQPIFNERELAHMEDVIRLFQIEQSVERGAWRAFMALVLLYALLRFFGARYDRREAFAGLVALGILVLPVLALFALGGFSFEGIFLKFHEALFTNDLWLLNPATDAMIRMYPQQFFEMMARDIGIRMGLAMLVIALVPLLILIPWRRNNREKRPNPGN